MTRSKSWIYRFFIGFIIKSRNVVHDNKLIKYIIFSHFNINMIIYVSFSLKKCQVHIKLVYCLRYLKSTRCWKQDNIFFSLSLENGSLDIQNISFNFPNNLFFANFCINVVFPHPVFPTTKMFFLVGVIYYINPSRIKTIVLFKVICFLATKFCFWSNEK